MRLDRNPQHVYPYAGGRRGWAPARHPAAPPRPPPPTTSAARGSEARAAACAACAEDRRISAEDRPPGGRAGCVRAATASETVAATTSRSPKFEPSHPRVRRSSRQRQSAFLWCPFLPAGRRIRTLPRLPRRAPRAGRRPRGRLRRPPPAPPPQKPRTAMARVTHPIDATESLLMENKQRFVLFPAG